MSQVIAAWLMLCCGVSWQTANKVLKALQMILAMFWEILVITMQTFATPEISSDICTVFGHMEVQPVII
jgi:hypothetical protein